MPARGQQDTGTCLHVLHTLGAPLPFLSSVLSSPSKEGVMFNEVPALQMSKTLPWITNHLRVQTEPLFLLSCCFCLPHASALLLCVWGETRAVHTHGAGAAAISDTSAAVTPPPNTRLSPVNHAYAACKISPVRDKPRTFVGKQILFCCKSITHCATFTIRLSMAKIKP